MFQTADNTFTETLKVDAKNVKIVPDATAKYLNAKVRGIRCVFVNALANGL